MLWHIAVAFTCFLICACGMQSTKFGCLCVCTDGSAATESMDKDDLVHDMESVSPRSHEDNLPVSQHRVLKFELQLYKLKDGQYLLDVQVC